MVDTHRAQIRFDEAPREQPMSFIHESNVASRQVLSSSRRGWSTSPLPAPTSPHPPNGNAGSTASVNSSTACSPNLRDRRSGTTMDTHKLVKMANEIAAFFEGEPVSLEGAEPR